MFLMFLEMINAKDPLACAVAMKYKAIKRRVHIDFNGLLLWF